MKGRRDEVEVEAYHVRYSAEVRDTRTGGTSKVSGEMYTRTLAWIEKQIQESIGCRKGGPLVFQRMMSFDNERLVIRCTVEDLVRSEFASIEHWSGRMS